MSIPVGPAHYEAGDFKVYVVALKGNDGEYLDVYGIFNEKTGVREAECRRLASAVAIADQFHLDSQPQGIPDISPSGELFPGLH